MVTCMRQRHSEASGWNVFSTPARTRSCLFILALIGMALSVPQEQVHGQIPFDKVPLQADKPLDRLPPYLSEKQYFERYIDGYKIADIVAGELVGRYRVIQVKYWFLWDDYVVPQSRWGLRPHRFIRWGAWDEYHGDEGWETICESEYQSHFLTGPLEPVPHLPRHVMRKLPSYEEASLGFGYIRDYLFGRYSSVDRSLEWLSRYADWPEPVPSFVWDWHKEFDFLMPGLQHVTVRYIEVEVYRGSDDRLRELHQVVYP